MQLYGCIDGLVEPEWLERNRKQNTMQTAYDPITGLYYDADAGPPATLRTAYDSETGLYYDPAVGPPRRSASQEVDRHATATQRSPSAERFDVFLCHNSEDKTEVREVAQQLRGMWLLPWLDEEQLRPGGSGSEGIEAAIADLNAAAVFVGAHGIGPWQRQEIRAMLYAVVKRQRPVIPVFLWTAPADADDDLPVFLADRTWVDFRDPASSPLDRLYWGITGRQMPSSPARTASGTEPMPAPRDQWAST